MYPNLALFGKAILSEAARRVVEQGITELDKRIDSYVESIKQKVERGDRNVRASNHSAPGRERSQVP